MSVPEHRALKSFSLAAPHDVPILSRPGNEHTHLYRFLFRIPWWFIPLAAALCILPAGLALTPTPGFSLDDAWTHQTFARTLATTGQFAFLPGRGPAGSTSPMWVFLLLPPYLILGRTPPLAAVVGWTALLGALSLGCLGVVTGSIAASIVEQRGGNRRVGVVAALLASLGTVSMWQLASFALSGMESVLFALAALLLIYAASRNVPPLWLGALAALIVYVRPEGVIPAALVAVGSGWIVVKSYWSRSSHLVVKVQSTMSRLPPAKVMLSSLAMWGLQWALPFAGAFVVVLIPYLALNSAGSGHIFPSTVYAKATVSGSGSLTARFSTIVIYVAVLFAPSPILLLLITGAWVRRVLNKRRQNHDSPNDLSQQAHPGSPEPLTNARDSVSGAAYVHHLHAPVRSFPLTLLLWLWPLALLIAYSGNFVEYALRYLLPALPSLTALAAALAAPLLFEVRRSLSVLLVVALIGLCTFSEVRGVQVYASTVQVTNQCWVTNALWIRNNLPPEQLLATHDIGAIGYFGGHPLIDMAGLVNPEVIPILNNERSIENYLMRRHVAYVVMWDYWFPPPAIMAHQFANSIVYSGCNSRFDVYRTGW